MDKSLFIHHHWFLLPKIQKIQYFFGISMSRWNFCHKLISGHLIEFYIKKYKKFLNHSLKKNNAYLCTYHVFAFMQTCSWLNFCVRSTCLFSLCRGKKFTPKNGINLNILHRRETLSRRKYCEYVGEFISAGRHQISSL